MSIYNGCVAFFPHYDWENSPAEFKTYIETAPLASLLVQTPIEQATAAVAPLSGVEKQKWYQRLVSVLDSTIAWKTRATLTTQFTHNPTGNAADGLVSGNLRARLAPPETLSFVGPTFTGHAEVNQFYSTGTHEFTVLDMRNCNIERDDTADMTTLLGYLADTARFPNLAAVMLSHNTLDVFSPPFLDAIVSLLDRGVWVDVRWTVIASVLGREFVSGLSDAQVCKLIFITPNTLVTGAWKDFSLSTVNTTRSDAIEQSHAEFYNAIG